MEGNYQPLLDSAALPDNSAERVEVDGKRFALARCAGKVHALDDACPHLGGSLGLGTVKDGQITCPLHHWSFDLETGKSRDGSAWEKVKVHPCREQEGKIEVAL